MEKSIGKADFMEANFLSSSQRGFWWMIRKGNLMAERWEKRMLWKMTNILLLLKFGWKYIVKDGCFKWTGVSQRIPQYFRAWEQDLDDMVEAAKLPEPRVKCRSCSSTISTYTMDNETTDAWKSLRFLFSRYYTLCFPT